MGPVCSALAVMWLVDLHDNRAIYLLSVLAFVFQAPLDWPLGESGA
jgi:hypothetical protein